MNNKNSIDATNNVNMINENSIDTTIKNVAENEAHTDMSYNNNYYHDLNQSMSQVNEAAKSLTSMAGEVIKSSMDSSELSSIAKTAASSPVGVKIDSVSVDSIKTTKEDKI